MNYLQSGTNIILKLVFPNYCLFCKQVLTHGILCAGCKSQLAPTDRNNRIQNVHFPQYIDVAYAAWWFNDILQEVIHQMKYADRARIGIEMGKIAAESFGNSVFNNLDFITAIPLHNKKKRERGYNQAGWIAKGISNKAGIPLDLKMIKRRVYTVSQTTLDREERLQNMESAFVTSRPLNGLKIGIIDDVLTTGATMSACAKALKENGAIHVMAMTLATPQEKI
ncbi:MAG: ComF family protein [Candidatus Marinimicrobia bacterium]|nr:ComF family protein [Candidatus Neomarinimicrobiota bacterium]